MTQTEKAIHYMTWTNFSAKEIADKTGLSRQEVYQIKHNLIKKEVLA